MAFMFSCRFFFLGGDKLWSSHRYSGVGTVFSNFVCNQLRFFCIAVIIRCFSMIGSLLYLVFLFDTSFNISAGSVLTWSSTFDGFVMENVLFGSVSIFV